MVNFDKDVLQLMREARYMQRLGLPIPDSARMVLLQEEKFTLYFNQLSHALRVRGVDGMVAGGHVRLGGPGKAWVRGQATSSCLRPRMLTPAPLLPPAPHQELDRLTARVPAVLCPLLQPHLDDLADKMQPGLLVLTWTSMNIDGYLHRFHQASRGWWWGSAGGCSTHRRLQTVACRPACIQ